jgi:hypothetical protein
MRTTSGLHRSFRSPSPSPSALVPLLVLLCACFDPGAEPPPEESLGTASSALYTASLSAAPSSVELGQTVAVTWSAPADHITSDWVGMFKVGAANNAYLAWQYVGGAGQTSGTLTFTVPLTPALDFGPFEFRYFSTGVKLATSNSVTGYANYSLTDTPAAVELGQTASVTWHAPLAHSGADYVTLAKVGSPDNVYLSWQYVGNPGLASGTLTFTIPLTPAVDPGPYEFRYFFSVKRATSASIAGYANYALTGTPGSVELGQTASVTWQAPLAHSGADYVTLAKVGTPDNSYLSWQYVGHPGETTGTLTFTVPLTQALDPGPYEFRYFYSAKRATSASFTGYAYYSVSAGGCTTGKPFTASWTAPLAHSGSDAIGVYNGAGGLVTWAYVGGAGQSSGTTTLTGPAPGGYELRYLFGSKITATGSVTCTAP